MNLSDYVRILGRGPGRARSLTQAEAYDAMTLMLDQDAPAEAVGAILMLLRMKGETAEEIAGFSQAAQAGMGKMPRVDLDWPSYAAGRTRGAPWFLQSAQRLANKGQRILLHGWNGADTKVREGLETVGIPISCNVDAAAEHLDAHNITYLPLETVHPALFRLLNLREVLGLRSCVNTVCRMLNPGAAPSSVQGVFHPSYRLLQADAATLLGWQNLSVIKGGGGEFECHPAKDIAAFGLRHGQPWQQILPASFNAVRRLNKANDPVAIDRWPNQPDEFELAVIDATETAARNTLTERPVARPSAA